jgi:hypothetical protein
MATHKPLQDHAFWLYGVLVGLAIKAGLEGTLPHIIQYAQLNELLTSQELTRKQSAYSFYPDLIRLMLLLFLVVRFYLGAAYFFSDVYSKDNEPLTIESQGETNGVLVHERTNYALDFISGFAHFLAFVILGLTIDVHTKPLYWFPVVVVFILLYDVIWWAFSIPYKKTRKIIKWWALVNAVNVAVSLVVFLTLLLLRFDEVIAEVWAYVLVFAVSAYDIGAMMKGRPYFEGVRDHLSE